MGELLEFFGKLIPVLLGLREIVVGLRNYFRNHRSLSSFFQRVGSFFRRLNRKQIMIVDSVRGQMVLDEASQVKALANLEDLEKNGEKWLRPALQKKMLADLKDQAVPTLERVKVGNALARVGDPRFRNDDWQLPADDLLGFVEIPQGKFYLGYGSTGDTHIPSAERPQHAVFLQRYYIGRYPVTVGQYRAFLADSGSDRTELLEPRIDNHPSVMVSWKDALAYCQWLNDRLCEWPKLPKLLAELLREKSWKISLPSEAEWEKAARGMTDPRLFPWASDPDENKANYRASGIHTTSPVGCFDGVLCPFPVHDLCGNVWEWTRSNWGEDLGKPQFRYPYDPADGRENIYAPDTVLRVMRGGSFRNEANEIRCTNRLAELPNTRYGHVGFRLVITK